MSRAFLHAAVDATRTDLHYAQPTLPLTEALVDTTGVSTVAAQRRRRRAQQRVEHADAQAEREKQEAEVLKVLVKSRRQALEEVKARIQRFQAHNAQLVNRIQSMEQTAMEKVQRHLVRYGQYTRSQITLKHRFTQSHAESEKQAHERLNYSREDTEKTQEQLTSLEQRIQSRTQELSQLALYRESGQYEMRRVIFKLRDKLNKVRARQAVEIKNVGREAEILRQTLMSSWASMVQQLQDATSERVLQALAPQVRAKALENISAVQELQRHRTEVAQRRTRVAALESENRQLQRALERSENRRKQLLVVAGGLASREPPSDGGETSASCWRQQLQEAEAEMKWPASERGPADDKLAAAGKSSTGVAASTALPAAAPPPAGSISAAATRTARRLAEAVSVPATVDDRRTVSFAGTKADKMEAERKSSGNVLNWVPVALTVGARPFRESEPEAMQSFLPPKVDPQAALTEKTMAFLRQLDI